MPTVVREEEAHLLPRVLLVQAACTTLQRCCRTRVLVEAQVKWVPNWHLVVVVVLRCLEVVHLVLQPATLALPAGNGGEEAPGGGGSGAGTCNSSGIAFGGGVGASGVVVVTEYFT